MDAGIEQVMNQYVATFWTHYAAMCTLKALQDAGLEAVKRPVPRALSSGCGTCVRYAASDPCAPLLHPDYEKVALVMGDGYETVMENDQTV